MIVWEAALYSFTNGAMLVISMLGLESAVVTPSLGRWDKRFFIIYFGILSICSAIFFLELSAYTSPDSKILLVVAYFLDSILSVIPFLMIPVYLLHSCGEDWRVSPLFRAMFALWALYTAMVIASQFTPVFYSVASDNQIVFGPAYLLSVAPIIAMMLLVASGVVHRRDKLSRQRYRAFMVCLLPVTLAVVVHTLVPVFALIGVGMAISAYAMYRIIESDSVEQQLRQQREIASQRSKIAVLQMRPHFIYNTMTSIYYLCKQDPDLAQQVTLDFTVYLRKNFAAIASEETIPFSEELEHTRAYLAVEQAQLESKLVVEYDTPHVHFRVPPLTLQPLAENAVKHGLSPETVPLRVCIRTRLTDSGTEIVVEDSGPGFDPAIADESHTTLANVRQRLKMMCGGTLDITSREGGGTVARVIIP